MIKYVTIVGCRKNGLIIRKIDNEGHALIRYPYIKNYDRLEFSDEIRFYSPATKSFYERYHKGEVQLNPIYRR